MPHASVRSLAIIAVSLLAGVWTHLFFDSMTHRYGPIVRHVPALRISLWVFAHHPVRVHHVLWYLFSFTGVAWLSITFQAWKARADPGSERPFISRAVTGICFGLAAVLIGAMHHANPGTIGDVVGGVCSLGLVAVALKTN
jgi:hypothetical protein